MELETNSPDFQWSGKNLLVVLSGFFLLSVALGVSSFLIVSILDQKFALELNPAERVIYINLKSHFLYYCSMIWFVHIMLKRRSLSLQDIIGSTRLPPLLIMFACLFGIALMFGQLVVHKAIYGIYWIAPAYQIGLGWILTFSLELIVLGFFPGIVEEVLFRGMVYRTMRKSMSPVKSGCMSSLCFLIFHISFISDPIFMTYIFLVGLCTALLFERTNSLIPSICFHAFGNFTERTGYYYSYYLQ